MAYQSLLTVVTDFDRCRTALNTAIDMAKRGDAHLDVLAIGVDRTPTAHLYAGANAIIQHETVEEARRKAQQIEADITPVLAGEGIRFACDTGIAQLSLLGRLIAGRARFADLVILPKPYGKDRGQEFETVTESALFDGRVPVLVCPDDHTANPAPETIVIGWNESNEALAAVRAALPMLQKAKTVSIAVIDPPTHSANRSDPGGPLSVMLSRHGVNADISILAKSMPRVADVLQRHLSDINADLLVMGAYGHSRFRESILGGATRYMLENLETPVMFAH